MISSRMNTLSHMQSLRSCWLEMLKGTRTPFLKVEHPNPGFKAGINFNNALYGPIAIRSNFFSFNLIRLDVFCIFFISKFSLSCFIIALRLSAFEKEEKTNLNSVLKFTPRSSTTRSDFWKLLLNGFSRLSALITTFVDSVKVIFNCVLCIFILEKN